MTSIPLSIREARSFLERNEFSRKAIRILLRHSISTKGLTFKKIDFSETYDCLKKFKGLLIDSDLYFQLNMENLIILDVFVLSQQAIHRGLTPK